MPVFYIHESIKDDDDDESIKLVFAHSYSKNSHECANEDMLWQTVQFLVHVGTRMIVDSCVAVPRQRVPCGRSSDGEAARTVAGCACHWNGKVATRS